MITKSILIKIPTGLEARPVALLVQVASQYESQIFVEADDKKVNAKSIMGMMMLAAECGSSLVIRVEGEDAEAALEALAALVAAGFGED